GAEERACERGAERPFTAERLQAGPGWRGERATRDPKAQTEKGEERIDRNRVLHLHERHAPHRSHSDENGERLHAAMRLSHRRRITPENGPTSRQYRANALRAESS